MCRRLAVTTTFNKRNTRNGEPNTAASKPWNRNPGTEETESALRREPEFEADIC